MFNSDRKYDNSGSYRRTSKIQLKKSFSECENYDNVVGVTETNFHSPAKQQQHSSQVQPSTTSTTRTKPKNTVAFQQPLFSNAPQSSVVSSSTTFKPALRTVSSNTGVNTGSSALSDCGISYGQTTTTDDFKKFNTVKTGGSNKSCLTNDALKTQYLLQQQQRIKEYNNTNTSSSSASNRNNELSYSDTYSSSSSDYRSIVKGGGAGPTTITASTGGSGGSNTVTASGRVMNSNVVSHSNSKNSLSTRKSTQSLCSCDAETEVSRTFSKEFFYQSSVHRTSQWRPIV